MIKYIVTFFQYFRLVGFFSRGTVGDLNRAKKIIDIMIQEKEESITKIDKALPEIKEILLKHGVTNQEAIKILKTTK